MKSRTGRDTARSATKAGVAAEQGERDKLYRYGDSVTPIALETYGRMGKKSIEGLRQIVNLASTATGFSRFRTGGDLLATLRYELEAALIWNIADIALLSLGASSRVW